MEELDAAMKQVPPVPVPVMSEHSVEELGLTFSCPYVWEVLESDGGGYEAYSRYDYANAWDMSSLFISVYDSGEGDSLEILGADMKAQGYIVNEISVDGHPAIDGMDVIQGDSGVIYYQRYLSVDIGSAYVDFSFITNKEYMEEADILFQSMIDSIRFDA